MRGCFDDFLRSYSPLIRNILDNDERHEIQILYTQVDRDSKNNPILNEYEYGVEAGNYFYPASSIKLPAALVALEKMAALSVPNLNRDTPLKIKISHNSQTAVDVDNSAHKGQPTLAHYIRKLFVVSDNDAYDRLYEWVGQHCLNETLWAKGYLDIRLTHRLSQPMSLENNRYTNEFVFYVEDGEIFRQPSQFSKEIFSVTSPILKGVGEVVDGVFKKKPKDFSGLNMVSVRILQDLMKAVVMPECLPVDRRFAISPDDRRFLLKVMSMLPFECNYPIYDRSKYYDSYVKLPYLVTSPNDFYVASILITKPNFITKKTVKGDIKVIKNHIEKVQSYIELAKKEGGNISDDAINLRPAFSKAATTRAVCRYPLEPSAHSRLFSLGALC